MKIIGCILYIADLYSLLYIIYILIILICAKPFKVNNTIADKVIINKKNNNVNSNY